MTNASYNNGGVPPPASMLTGLMLLNRHDYEKALDSPWLLCGPVLTACRLDQGLTARMQILMAVESVAFYSELSPCCDTYKRTSF